MKKVDFTPPPAFKLPEGKQDGDRFSVLAEFEVKGEKLCLVGLDGNDMPGYEDKEKGASDSVEESDKPTFSKLYQGAQGG